MMRKLSIIIAIVLLPTLVFAYVIGDGDWTYKTDPMGENIYFNPNCADGGCGSDEDQINALWQGAKAWQDWGLAEFEFPYGGTTTRNSVLYDNWNIVFFSPTSNGSAIAATYYWVSSGNMTECDMIFYDGAWNFNAYMGPSYNEFDVWDIAAHEFGHYLQLDHSPYYYATMYAYSNEGETYKRDLYSDDIAGIQAIYGMQDPFSVILETNDDSYARVFTQSGGSFSFTVTAYNNTSTGRYFRATIDLILPDGSEYGPLMNVNSVYIGPNATLTYNSTQNIPGGAPVGEYKYRARMRHTSSPYDDYDVSYFMFWVNGTAKGNMGDISYWKLPEGNFVPVYESQTPGSDGNVPGVFELKQNVPNPFNPTTNISFNLYEDASVTLEVYNIRGQKIKTLIDNRYSEIGPYRVVWDATDNNGAPVSAGVYLYKLDVGNKTAVKKMILIK